MINNILAVLLVILSICLFFIDNFNVPHILNTILVIITFIILIWFVLNNIKNNKNKN